MRESEYQAKLINKLKTRFPSCIVIKNDPNYIQGIPDLIVLCGDKWPALEVKIDEHAPHRPNQGYYVKHMNDMSYASFVFPENESDVLFEVEQIFKGKRK
jgi:hypothetical protein